MSESENQNEPKDEAAEVLSEALEAAVQVEETKPAEQPAKAAPSTTELPPAPQEEVKISFDGVNKELEAARAKAAENWDMLVRAKAEIENLRKRHERELENAHKYGLDRFANELLQVRDSLELGHQAALDEATDLAKLREGTELTLKLLTDVMDRFGVEQIDPEGKPFDHEQHQAMMMQPKEDVEPNTVIQVLQKGYSLNGRLLRPAMVIVSQSA
ncbi:MAG: nucleotide exchange factor GrpE [Gammaproteobacteria bacterium]|nr:nucleotide exchange factor GrpE [Gammaproteobacteria bacterium]MBU1654964.1 nucleotide exchange factor GrpE [Gammaproteobacteria bacterium]MBU1960070.1 nucleotide exchange factor GrpE [Gammaproteobacteria bacterium]